MKPLVILSTNDNPDYLFCLPIVAKSWELQGWDVCANVESFKVVDCVNKRMEFGSVDWYEHEVKGLTTSSVAQIKRLYDVCNLLHDRTVCIGDVDMFIGSDFLYKRFDQINVFGHDLTGREHIPMCYVTATRDEWREIMEFDGKKNWEEWMLPMIKRFGGSNPWCWDQDILTGLLKEFGYEQLNFIDRGIDPSNHNLPLGRWDRYGGFKRPAGQVHDCHLPRTPYFDVPFNQIKDMCNDLYPKEDWSWLDMYRNEFLIENKIAL